MSIVTMVSTGPTTDTECLRDPAEALAYGLSSFGEDVKLMTNMWDPKSTNYLVGWHSICPEFLIKQGGHGVIYNLEQLCDRNASMIDRLLGLSDRFEIWDYSAYNIEQLKRGCRGVLKWVPPGYVRQQTRIIPAENQDIDVLFYGSMNEEREKIVASIINTGLNVKCVFGVYGMARDALIARSKVVLNMHFYDSRILESVRLMYLLANGKAVVSQYEDDTKDDTGIGRCVMGAKADCIADACLEVVNNYDKRKELERIGLFWAKGHTQSDYIKRARHTGGSGAQKEVSVIIPTKNRNKFLFRALESVTRQILPPREVIIVNDGDPEGVGGVEDRFSGVLNIRIVPNRGHGVSAARNTGLDYSTGKYITYLDDDDTYVPNHISGLVSALERTGAMVAYSDSHLVTEEDRDGEMVETNRRLHMSNDYRRGIFQEDNITPIINVMHARKCYEAIGGFDETLDVLEDWDYWIRMSRYYDFLHVPTVTAEVHWRSNGANTTFEKSHLFPTARVRIASKTRSANVREHR